MFRIQFRAVLFAVLVCSTASVTITGQHFYSCRVADTYLTTPDEVVPAGDVINCAAKMDLNSPLDLACYVDFQCKFYQLDIPAFTDDGSSIIPTTLCYTRSSAVLTTTSTTTTTTTTPTTTTSTTTTTTTTTPTTTTSTSTTQPTTTTTSTEQTTTTTTPPLTTTTTPGGFCDELPFGIVGVEEFIHYNCTWYQCAMNETMIDTGDPYVDCPENFSCIPGADCIQFISDINGTEVFPVCDAINATPAVFYDAYAFDSYMGANNILGWFWIGITDQTWDDGVPVSLNDWDIEDNTTIGCGAYHSSGDFWYNHMNCDDLAEVICQWIEN